MSLTLPKQRRLSQPLVGPALRYRTANVNDIKLFYREVGRQEAPALLLLHGFPTASHTFQDLILLLADRFRFALEIHSAEVAVIISEFLQKKLELAGMGATFSQETKDRRARSATFGCC